MTVRRVALVVPHSNTVMQGDLRRDLEGDDFEIIRVEMHLRDPIDHDAEQQMLREGLGRALREVEEIRPDAVVFGCSSAGSTADGMDVAGAVRASAAAAGAPAVDAMQCVLDRVDELGLERVSILTPYTDAVSQAVGRTFGARLWVDRLTGLGLSRNSAVAAVDPTALAKHARAAVDPRSDGLVIMCTNLRASEVEQELEQGLGTAVVTVNGAVTKSLARILGP